MKSKTGYSKYDFVKVRVYIAGEHYYVLSRYLTCRVLTAAKVEYGHAVRMALDLKKRLVDSERLDVTQEELERHLFEIMRQVAGYGEQNIRLYRMLARFHHERIPLLIFIAGTVATGKSTIATLLAERLNLPSVLQTDVIHGVVTTPRINADLDAGDTSGWVGHAGSEDQVVSRYLNDCVPVEQCLDPDIARCVSAGKSMIVEGVHVRPSWTQRIAERHESAANGGDMETKCSDHDTNPKSNTSIAAVVISFLLVAEHDVALHTRRIEEWLGRRCDYEGNVTTVCDKAIANIRAVQAKLLEEATPATIIIDTTVGADESAAKSRCSTADSVAVISPEESSTFVLNRMHDEILDRITAHMSGRSL